MSDKKQITVRADEPSVALMLQEVIKGGITAENVSALEALVGLYDRMQAKNAEREFNQAFAKLQSELRSVNATRTVPNKDGSPRYRFAPFEDIMEEVQPVLVAKFGFLDQLSTPRFMASRAAVEWFQSAPCDTSEDSHNRTSLPLESAEGHREPQRHRPTAPRRPTPNVALCAML